MEEYSDQFNVKIVGMPLRTEKETPEMMANLFLQLFIALDVKDVSLQVIDIAHRVPARQVSSRPNAIIAAAASEPEASEQGSNPNLYMWVKFSILPLAHCIMVPIVFYHNAARSVALKCTCVVAVWSFFHCFDFRKDRVSFQAERFSGEFFMTMLIFQQCLLMLSTYYIV